MRATQYLLRVSLPDGQSQDYPLSGGDLTLGRAADNDVSLPDPLVSGHHARVILRGADVLVSDLGSRNGTFVNGQRIPPQSPRPISLGDTVGIGNTTLRIQPVGGQRDRAPLARVPAGLVLQVQVAGVMDEVSIVKGELGIGRADDNDVIIDSPLVSSHHARLSLALEGGGFAVMDLGSLNGTRVNGQPLGSRVSTRIEAGDHIQIADLILSLRVATAEIPAPPPLSPQVRVATKAQAGLIVYLASRQARHPIDRSGITLGRGDGNDIVIQSPAVSGHHARIDTSDGTVWITDLGSRNGLSFGGQRIQQKVLSHGDVLYIGREVALEFRERLSFQPVAPRPAAAQQPTQRLELTSDTVTIGRSRENAVVLDHPLVSRFHAVVERLGMRQRITDLKSSNGVFVNGKRIEKQGWLKEGDEIRIGPYRMRVGENVLHRVAEVGLRIDALRLKKWVSKKKNLLQDISLSIFPQEFVALVGLSGSGKSTLMDSINGFRPATHGTVLVNNANLYRNFDMFRNDMGYVPQRDIVHTELTVYRALDYAAQLRMPADTSPEERHQRITEVLDELDLSERKDLPINKLSGGQLKRVSIGVELLTKPRLFFLDEPTSGLDPGTEYNMMRLLRRLADQGRTVLLITHATKNVMMCDKVIILVRGGYMAYYGPPEEALPYFDQFRTDHERRTKDIEFDDVYPILEDEERGTAEEWDARYKRSSQYADCVVNRLRERGGEASAAAQPTGATAAGLRRQATPKRVSAVRQFFILSKRNLNIMAQDKATLALMLAIAPLIGLMDFMWGRELFDPVEGDPGKIITMLFMMGLVTLLVGALASVREIVKEADIYKRERAINLKIVPYIMSKVWVGLVLSFYQALAFLILKWVMVGLGPGQMGMVRWAALYVTLFLGAMSGYLIGLTISAAAPNQNMALLLIIVVLVPQFLFAGGLLPLDLIPGGGLISNIVSTRWSFEAAINIIGFGQPLLDDPCWDNREKHDTDGDLGWNTILNRDSDEKAAAGCQCMGSSIFSGPCADFPGILNEDYYTGEAQDALSRSEPQQPVQPTPWPTLTPYPTPTPYPTMTPLPTPENPADFDSYMDDMQDQGDEYRQRRQEQGDEYQEARERQGDEYQEIRERQGDEYEDQMADYADERAEWQQDREKSIGGAEGMLKAIFEGYGYVFRGSYVSRWIKMGLIDLGLLVLIVVFQRRKDVV